MKSMPSDGKNQQLSLLSFPAESKPIRKPKSLAKAKRKRPEVVYTYQFTSEAPTVPVHRVPTDQAANLLKKNIRSMRRGSIHRAQAFHGGTLVVVWAGINPENHREYLWDIHLEQAS